MSHKFGRIAAIAAIPALVLSGTAGVANAQAGSSDGGVDSGSLTNGDSGSNGGDSAQGGSSDNALIDVGSTIFDGGGSSDLGLDSIIVVAAAVGLTVFAIDVLDIQLP